jgi:hypothetical protein
MKTILLTTLALIISFLAYSQTVETKFYKKPYGHAEVSEKNAKYKEVKTIYKDGKSSITKYIINGNILRLLQNYLNQYHCYDSNRSISVRITEFRTSVD